jgi:hypothetical protein
MAHVPSAHRNGVAGPHVVGHAAGVIAHVPLPHLNGDPIGQSQAPPDGRQDGGAAQVTSPGKQVTVPQLLGQMPPQSIPVSVPFLTPSAHVGTGGAEQTPATQLPIGPHELPQTPQLKVSVCRLFVRIGPSWVTCPAVTATGFTLMKNPGGISS